MTDPFFPFNWPFIQSFAEAGFSARRSSVRNSCNWAPENSSNAQHARLMAITGQISEIMGRIKPIA